MNDYIYEADHMMAPPPLAMGLQDLQPGPSAHGGLAIAGMGGGQPGGGGGGGCGMGGGGGNQKERFARENHSEIERRRRNKMTHYINELAEMVPQCAALGRKPDKLTILRMAVSHMKQIREVSAPQDPTLASAASYKPTFLTDQELKHMILEAANGFLFVVACDTGRVLYVADSILPVLNLRPDEWLHHSVYDLVHPDDMDKVRDQLCASEANFSRTLDLKTGTAKKDQRAGPPIHMSCRRGFICRMKLGNIEPLHRLRNRRPLFQHNGQTYVVMHCTGYVKQSPPVGVEQTQASCMVGVARLQVASMPAMKPGSVEQEQFTMRWNEEGKITFADQRLHQLLDLRPDDVVGRFCWQCAHPNDEQVVRDSFQRLLQGQPFQVTYRLQKPDGTPVPCLVEAFKFMNPYSEQFEYVVATARVLDANNGAQSVVVSGAPVAAPQLLDQNLIQQQQSAQQQQQQPPQHSAGLQMGHPGGFEPVQWAQPAISDTAIAESVVAAAAAVANYQPAQLDPRTGMLMTSGGGGGGGLAGGTGVQDHWLQQQQQQQQQPSQAPLYNAWPADPNTGADVAQWPGYMQQ